MTSPTPLSREASTELDRWQADHGGHVELRALIDSAVRELDGLLPKTGRLVDTHQRGIGFLTVEAAKVMNDLVRQERRDRVDQAKAGIKLTGATPAPGNINAYSVREEAQRFADEYAAILTYRLERAGVCLVHGHVFSSLGIRDHHLARLVDLIHVTTKTSLLHRIHTDVEQVTARARRLVDGNDTKALPEPCPFCGRHTLVAYLTDGVIRCERDPKTGQHETCVCDDSYCHCKTAGHRRHEWHRTKGSQKWGWYGLRQDQTRATPGSEGAPPSMNITTTAAAPDGSAG